MKYFVIAIFSFFVSESQAQKRILIVGEEVNLREDANLKSKKNGSLSTGQTAIFLQKSKKKEAIGKEADATCDAFFWYKIQTADQKTGWVYGKYAYILDSLIPTKNPKADHFVLNGQNYQLFYAKYTGERAFEEDGITGCDADDYLFLVPTDSPQKAHPIHLGFSKTAFSWEKIYLDKPFNPRGVLLLSEGTHVFKSMQYEPEKERLVLTCRIFAQDTPSKEAKISIVYEPKQGLFKAYLEKLVDIPNDLNGR
jgi:hypothetical protein